MSHFHWGVRPGQSRSNCRPSDPKWVDPFWWVKLWVKLTPTVDCRANPRVAQGGFKDNKPKITVLAVLSWLMKLSQLMKLISQGENLY